MSADPTQLAGHLRLHPGAPLPTVSGGRPDLAPRLARGRRAHELPALLGALFTLCSHAHRYTAQRAVQAALGQSSTAALEELQGLRAATAREQVLRIVHDWPRLLGGCDTTTLSQRLAACPLWHDALPLAERIAAFGPWLEAHWLGMSPSAWLARQAADPDAWPRQWCHMPGRSALATLLRREESAARLALTGSRPLALLADPQRTPATMAALASSMAEREDFCARPTWQGTPAETGPWTRAHEADPRPAHSAWSRLVARLVDVLHLAAPGGEHWLAQGALPLGAGHGIAWTEMSRGLLVHRVQLDGSGPDARVTQCQVLAPTEWNFHPRGVLAQALAALRGDAAERQARRLAVAFDPCVEFDIQAWREPAHA